MNTDPENTDFVKEWMTSWKMEAASLADARLAVSMSAYMKNKFDFYGIPKPVRATLTKPFMEALKKQSMNTVWGVVEALWSEPFRESHYLAIELLRAHQKRLRIEDLDRLEKLIVTHSWWDSVDALAAHPVGTYFLLYPDKKKSVTGKWAAEENIWLARVSIIFQLTYKDRTDFTLLSENVLLNAQSREFFILKAIGWALRQYARTNPERVLDFVRTTNLKPLSKREALKHF